MLSQEERNERSTQALMTAAAELIAEGGLANATFTAIGERAGYSRGMVTARFGSKAGLVEALLRDSVHRFGQLRQADPPGASGLGGLTVLLETIRQYASAETLATQVLFGLQFEALSSDDLRVRMTAFHRAMRDEIAEFIERGVEDGSIRADAVGRDQAVLIVGLLRGIAYQWLLDPDGVDVDSAYANMNRLVVRDLSAG